MRERMAVTLKSTSQQVYPRGVSKTDNTAPRNMPRHQKMQVPQAFVRPHNNPNRGQKGVHVTS
jgi:hypothetical protein